MNGFFQRNKWLYFIHIFFVKHFKVTKIEFCHRIDGFSADRENEYSVSGDLDIFPQNKYLQKATAEIT